MLKNLTGGDHPQSFTYLLGLTATPQSVTLDKFKLLYRYSFEQAISDGIILDPAPHMYDYIIVPSEAITTEEAKSIYLEEDRIDKVNEHIKSILKFQLAQGVEPKAMLCCDSVLAANKQFEQLQKTLLVDSALSGFPLFLYHTNASQSTYEDLSPKELISQFKNLDKGLIVVVDKLQTGYDDPKLNILFLNKLLSGVSAVQAVNRVTRKHPGKQQCLIISYADKGGIAAIKEAFDTYKYQLTPVNTFTPISLQTLNELKKQLDSNSIFQYFKTHATLDFSTLRDIEISPLIAQVEDYIKIANNYFIKNSSATLSAWDIQWNRHLKRFLNILNAYSGDETELLKYIDSSSGIEFKTEGLFNGQEEATIDNEDEESITKEPTLIQVESTNELFDEASVESWHSYAQLDSVIQTKHMYFKMLKVCIGLENPKLLTSIARLKGMDTPIIDESLLKAVAEVENRVKVLLHVGDNTSKEFVSRMGNYYISGSALLFNEFLAIA
jgi:type I site-specific restriction-modification system R (restriction) subunit